MRFLRAALLLAAMAGAACDGSTGTSSVNGPSSPNQALLTAIVDGAGFAAVPSSITATSVTGILRLSGSDAATGSSARTLELTIVATGPGIYPIGPPSGTAGTSASLTVGGARWVADSIMGNGSITVNTLTSSRASGTFLFNAAPVPGTEAAGTRIVTEGVFTVTF